MKKNVEILFSLAENNIKVMILELFKTFYFKESTFEY